MTFLVAFGGPWLLGFLWWLIGFATPLLWMHYIDRKDVLLRDVSAAAWAGMFGPFLVLLFLIDKGITWLDERPRFDGWRVVWKARGK